MGIFSKLILGQYYLLKGNTKGGCVTISNDNFQKQLCCEDWALKQKVEKPSCIGSWKNNCEWECNGGKKAIVQTCEFKMDESYTASINTTFCFYDNIPEGLEYALPSERIPPEKHIFYDYEHSENMTKYLINDGGGEICNKTGDTPEIARFFYMVCPNGVSGCGFSRTAHICDDEYFIEQYQGSPTFYGPFRLNEKKESKQQCLQEGGKWSVGDWEYCNPATKDRNKTCMDSTQCESGYCLVNNFNDTSGKCFEYKYKLGSFCALSNGRVTCTSAAG